MIFGIFEVFLDAVTARHHPSGAGDGPTGHDEDAGVRMVMGALGEHVQDPQLMMAGAVLTILPVVVLFLLLQRYYLEGLVAGGVKD